MFHTVIIYGTTMQSRGNEHCVLMFFVPTSALVMSDLLAKALGPRNSMASVTRIYRYYFERKKDHDMVRLRDTVVHAQRGCANVHYTMYMPDDTAQPSCDKDSHGHACTEVSGDTTTFTRSSLRCTPPATYTHLRSSAVTDAFPVLRPTIVSKVKLAPLQRNSQYCTASARHTSCEATDVDTLHVQQPVLPWQRNVSGNDNPFAANDTREWPMYARLACSLSFKYYVSIAEAAALCRGVDLADVELMLSQATTSQWTLLSTTFLYTDEPLTTPERNAQGTHARATMPTLQQSHRIHRPHAIRQRPFWLAPYCCGERCTSELPPAFIQLLRPVWTPLGRVLQRLDQSTLAFLVQNTTMKAGEPFDCTVDYPAQPSSSKDVSVALSQLSSPGELLKMAHCLQQFGHFCCVDTSELRIRRYTANSELDDMTHILIHLLKRCATTHKQPLREVLATMDDLCTQCMTTSPQSEKKCTNTHTNGLAAQLRYCMASTTHRRLLLTFLRSHTKEIEVSTSDENDEIYVKRRAQYATVK